MCPEAKLTWTGVMSQKFGRILTIVKALDLKNPCIVEASTSLQQIKFVKVFSNDNQIVSVTKFLRKIEETTSDVIIFLNNDVISQIKDKTLSPKAFDSKTVIIISDDKGFQNIEGLLLLDINQKVYFYSTTTFEVSESYQINEVTIKRNLGSIKKQNGVYIFLWNDSIAHK